MTTSPDAPLDPITLREDEVAQYQANVDLYTVMTENLPSEWPEHLAHLKDAPDTHAAIAGVEDLADVTLVAQLWAHDQAQAAIRAEMVEQAKAQAILDAMKAARGATG